MDPIQPSPAPELPKSEPSPAPEPTQASDVPPAKRPGIWAYPSVAENLSKAQENSHKWPHEGQWPWTLVRELAADDDDVLVEGLLLPGDQAILSGPPKSGKSFLALQLAMSLAVGSGKFLLDQWKVLKARRVLFVSLEMMPGAMAARIRSYELLLSADPAIAGGNLKFLFIGSDEIAERDNPYGILHWRRILGAIEEHAPEFIIIDTLIQVHSEDENDNVSMSRIMKGLRRLCRLLAAHPETNRREGERIAHLLVHHNRKASQAKAYSAGVSEARGAGAIHSEVDLALVLDPKSSLYNNVFDLATSARNTAGARPTVVKHSNDPVFHFVAQEEPTKKSPDKLAAAVETASKAALDQFRAEFGPAAWDPRLTPPAIQERIYIAQALVDALRDTTPGHEPCPWTKRQDAFTRAGRRLGREGATESFFKSTWEDLQRAGVTTEEGKTQSKVFRLKAAFAANDDWRPHYERARAKRLQDRK